MDYINNLLIIFVNIHVYIMINNNVWLKSQEILIMKQIIETNVNTDIFLNKFLDNLQNLVYIYKKVLTCLFYFILFSNYISFLTKFSFKFS